MIIETREQLESLMTAGGGVYLHPDELPVLARYAAQSKHILVIGTAFAGSDIWLLIHQNEGVLHSIDPFVKDTYGDWCATEDQARGNIAAAAQALGVDWTRRWVFHRGTSHDVIGQVPTRFKTELVFIDGDHTYKGVRQDVEDWLPKIKKGGYLLIHDSCRVPGTPEKEFNAGWPGPTQVAQELKADARVEFVESIYSLSVWRKA